MSATHGCLLRIDVVCYASLGMAWLALTCLCLGEGCDLQCYTAHSCHKPRLRFSWPNFLHHSDSTLGKEHTGGPLSTPGPLTLPFFFLRQDLTV